MSSKERTTLLRRGFIMGYRAGLRKVQKDFNTMADNFDAELARLEDKFSVIVEAAAELWRDRVDHVVEAVVAEHRAIQQATSERLEIPDCALN